MFLLCVFVHTVLMRTVRRCPWLLEADRIMITCTRCTCPVSTAAAAATAARPASLQEEHTLSATLLLRSTCELNTHTHVWPQYPIHMNTYRSPVPFCEGSMEFFCRNSLIFSLTDTSYWFSHIFYYISFGSSMWHHSFITDKLSHSQTKMTMEINTTLFRSQTCFV